MTAARAGPCRPTSRGAAGVGSTPPSSASPPAAHTPALRAASSMSPDSRVSRRMRTCGRAVPRTARASSTAARPRASASSAVSFVPAAPRTPSVPNRRRTKAAGLALGELRALAGLLEPGLLALLHARVTREKAAALELAAEVRVRLEERAGDAVAQRVGLGGDAATVHARDDVELRLEADGLERVADRLLQRVPGEEVLERPGAARVRARDAELARAGREVHTGHGALALADDVALVGVPGA